MTKFSGWAPELPKHAEFTDAKFVDVDEAYKEVVRLRQIGYKPNLVLEVRGSESGHVALLPSPYG